MSREPTSIELETLRQQVGGAIWEARLSEARERERLLMLIQEATDAGHHFSVAARTHAPEFSPGTLKEWNRRWRNLGLVGLVKRNRGPPPEAVRSPKWKPKRRRTATVEQLSLPELTGASASTSLQQRGRNAGKVATLLKLPGSKIAIVEKLTALAPAKFKRYHEPFVGTGALFFTLRPQRAVLSDRNAEFVNVYSVARDEPELLIEALAQHQHTQEHFYQVRGMHPDSLPPVERAARTLFLCRTCFNGLYRVNRHGLFNVPYGDQPLRGFFLPEVIRATHQALAGVETICDDFASCADRARPGDFIYLDPPYATGIRQGVNFKYQTGGFGEEDQRRVADLMRLLDQRGCFVMASNADCALTRKLYRKFDLHELSVRRYVGGHAGRRGMAAEILVRNYGD